MPRLSKAEVAAIIDGELSRVETSQSGLQDNRIEALNYLYGRPRGDEIDGRSQVVSTDVSDMIHAVLSQVMPGLAGTDFPCSFMPDGPDDAEAARAESDAVSKAIMNDNDGYQLIYSLVWNALALKNGWAKVWVEDQQTVTVREFEDATDSDIEMTLAQELPENVEMTADGQTLRRVETRKVLRVESIEPENIVYPIDTVSIDKARFIAERKIMMRGELLELGFSRSKVERLPVYTISSRNADTVVRKVGGVEDPAHAPQKAQDRIEVWEFYTKIDVKGNGIPQLMRYMFAGKEILDDGPVDFIPYATGSGWPVPGRITGSSMHDRLKSIQDINTALFRSTLDNFASSNYQEVVVNENANPDDFLNRRPGGINRVEGDVRAAVMAMPIVPQVDAGLQMMQHLRSVRAERGGAALEMATGEMQLFESQIGSQGLDRSMSVQEQMAGMVAKNLATSLIKELYLLTHRVIRTQLRRPIMVMLAGQWQQLDPQQFKPRNYVTLKAGLTQGEQTRKQAAMSQLMNLQKTMLEAGWDDVLVSLDNVHTTVMDFARCQGVEAPERYFIDPQSPESIQARQGKAEAAQQQARQQQQVQQQALQLEAMDRQTKQAELQFKYWAERLKSEVEEAKIVAEQIGALELAELNATQAAGSAAAATGGSPGPQSTNGQGAGT